MTDHNTTEGAFKARAIADFTVIIGEEINTTKGEVTGLFLEETIPRGLTPLETVKQIKEQGGLVSIPHPFDRFRGNVITHDGLEEILPYADIIEVFNARNTLDSDNRKAFAFATEHSLLPSGVSDAHTLMELGRTYVEMPEFNGTPEGFKIALAQGKIHRRKMNPLIHVVTTFTKLKKRFLRRTR